MESLNVVVCRRALEDLRQAYNAIEPSYAEARELLLQSSDISLALLSRVEQSQNVVAALAAFEGRGGWDALELYLSAEPQTIDATCNDDEGEIQTLESGAAQLLREVKMLRAEVAK